MLPEDRRAFQRLRLNKPILATAKENQALILDLGVAGALIEHYGIVHVGDELPLSFRWQGEDVQFHCEVVRSVVIRAPGGDGASPVSHTGLRFVSAVGESAERLKDLIATFVGRVLAAQRANASGSHAAAGTESILDQLGHARRTRSRGYVSWMYRGGKWWRVPTQSPLQPVDGFTVAAHEDEDEVEQLCRTYEQADDEGRRLIRLVAELSVMSVPSGS